MLENTGAAIATEKIFYMRAMAVPNSVVKRIRADAVKSENERARSRHNRPKHGSQLVRSGAGKQLGNFSQRRAFQQVHGTAHC